MKELIEHFFPNQPSIDHSLQTDVIYEEQKPNNSLNPYIYCYWNLRTKQKLKDVFKYRVVSDGCIDILFEQSNSKDIFITGFSPRFIEYDLQKTFNYVGIRFFPSGFPTLFEISATRFTNKFLPLKEIVPDLYKSINEVARKKQDLTTNANLFDGLFTQILEDKEVLPIPDKRFMNAFGQILKSGGGIKMSELDIAVSERQLRRLFEYYFGESPKTFAKVLRFQNILRAKPTTESLKKNKIFYDEGYYDQAHFIKEFKEFYGVTPGQAFGY